MQHLHDERNVFITATDDSLKQFREKAAKEWKQIDEERNELKRRMADSGVKLVQPDTGDHTIARLNVGGLDVDIPYHLSLQQENAGSSGLILSALLFGIWDEWLPRDSRGRLFVDASPELAKQFLEVAAHSYKRLAKSVSSSPLQEHFAPFCGSAHPSPFPQGGGAAEVRHQSIHRVTADHFYGLAARLYQSVNTTRTSH